MFHINIASLSLHWNDLKTVLSILDHQFDIIAITETKIIENIQPITNFSLEGYNFEYTPTKNDKGGVGIFFKKDFECEKRDDLSKSVKNVAESVFIEVKSKETKNLLIGCIYRHHNSIQEFNSTFLMIYF